MELSKPPFFVQISGCRMNDFRRSYTPRIEIEGLYGLWEDWPETLNVFHSEYKLESVDREDPENEIADYRRVD